MKPIVAIDFDGTIVTHEYPRLGADIGAMQWLKMAQERGARLLLLTMRHGQPLDEALEYCRRRDVEFWSVNHNPEQSKWSESPKVYAHLYIDDSGLAMPLTRTQPLARPYVDWPTAGPLLSSWLDRWRG